MNKGPDRVAVIRGGQSAEREISLKSGRAVREALQEAPCQVETYDTGRSLGERLRSDGIDVAFIALHGRGGEDGVIQGMLEWNDIAYTGPGVEASSTCMDKFRCKQIFRSEDWQTPRWFVIRHNDEIVPESSFERYVVKPRFEGSSLGISIVTEENLEQAVNQARDYDRDILVEEFVDGYEVTVGIVKLDSVRVFRPVGIRPQHEFFDFDTKYTRGLTEYDVPADLDQTTEEKVKRFAEEVARELGTEALCRVDFVVSDGEPYLLEVNTIPGLTETSLLPKAAREADLSFPNLIWSMVQSAWKVNRWHAA